MIDTLRIAPKRVNVMNWAHDPPVTRAIGASCDSTARHNHLLPARAGVLQPTRVLKEVGRPQVSGWPYLRVEVLDLACVIEPYVSVPVRAGELLHFANPV